MREEVYRGYRIVYYRAGKWFARIYAPGSDVLLGDRHTTATVRDTKSGLLERAQKRIDQHIAEQVPTERPQG